VALALAAIWARSGTWHGDAQLHTLVELGAALLALTAGTMSLVRYYAKKSSSFLLLGSCFLGAGVLDAYHGLITSSYLQGHTPSALSGLTVWSGALPRVFLSLLLCVSLLEWKKPRRTGGTRIREALVYTSVAMWAIASFTFFALVTVKPVYYPNFVLHRPSQLAQALFFAIALGGYLWKGDWKRNQFEHCLVLALIAATASDFAFMEFYKSLYDAQFIAGHLLKILAYLFILFGLFGNTYSIFKKVAQDATTLEIRVSERTAELESEIAVRQTAQVKLQHAILAAEAASRAKSEFLANMSHEIRTPLNGVIGMTDLVLDTELSGEQQECLKTVKLSGESLLVLINDILDFSKIEAGKMELDETDFNLYENIESTMKTLALRADEKGLELLCDLASDLPPVVRGDSTRLRQVVLNVVSNAIKFTSKGEVVLKVESLLSKSSDNLLHFTVTDTGIGIPPEKQTLIFEPFSQADNSTTRNFGGTGLGLTICTRLVAMMGGTIWVNSEVAKGTQFHFTVRMPPANGVTVDVSRPAISQNLAGVRVLIVDDNITNRQILEKLLERWGMKTTSADSAIGAIGELTRAQEQGTKFDLLLTDMHMPDMDGFELIERIRERPELSTKAIVMLGSTSHRGDSTRCKELGVESFLQKPIPQNELRSALAKALDRTAEIHTLAAVPAGLPRAAAKDGLNILVAEDNKVNQTLLTRLLEKRGHRVRVVVNGREAVEALSEETYDVVLMDVQMPVMDGLEATIAIREAEKDGRKQQPIVALTAHAMKGDRDKCLAAGMNGYLTKPIRAPELEAALQIYIARRESQSLNELPRKVRDEPKERESEADTGEHPLSQTRESR
jgi:signal transduction histidine kinase/CheY-like chemotaxis protein